MNILVGSRAHICFHEAGHIEAAYLFGATVAEATVDGSGNPRTSISHKQDLSTKEPVACGGYAAESLIFQTGDLVDEAGSPLSEEAFKHQAMQNAFHDKFPFFIKKPFDHQTGIYPGGRFQPVNGSWPQESDASFIAYAEQNIVPALKVRRAVVEALARELDRKGQLTQKDIESIRVSCAAGSDA